ncbi:hypothetical protein V6N13_045880 [Hibiscus sabdariffa]|uniref:Uncharacterized protein n=1 Tax=Hibiscus sabdariffa TaxID=183260 RepID=A0ABR2BEA3_9ROSI
MNPNISKGCWGWGGRGAEAAKESACALLSFACCRSQFWWLLKESINCASSIEVETGDLKETLQELTTIPKRKILLLISHHVLVHN